MITMKEFLSRTSSSLNQLINLKLFSERQPKVLLFDSATAASDIAFMLDGVWDGCNGVVMPNLDSVAINTAANLVGALWCNQGDSTTLLIRLTTDELLRRYATGERNFTNANLRGAVLIKQYLSQSNLSYAKLNWANLSEANLSGVDLTGADLSYVNLSGANLNYTNLNRTNLRGANLSAASLRGANFNKAFLSEVIFRQADLREANFSLADLRGANFDEASLDDVNLTGAKITQGQFPPDEIL